MATHCPDCQEYHSHSDDVCPKCGYNFITQKRKDGTMLTKQVPNPTKSIEGVYYPFQSKFMIEEAKSDTEENSPRHKPYVLHITFPADVRTGFYPRDIVLEDGQGHSMIMYYNGWSEDKAGVKRLKQRLKDLQKLNRILVHRNQALERHFSLTEFERNYQESKKNRQRFDCDHCGDPIDTKILIEGKDYILTEDGGLHIRCTSKVYNSHCSNCNMIWSNEDIEDGCPECGGELNSMTEDEVIKFVTFDAIKKHLPEELRDKVMFKPNEEKKDAT